MPEQTKVCRVCGKTYKACLTRNTGAFRYQEVACSSECGAKYLAAVQAARAPKEANDTEIQKDNKTTKKNKVAKKDKSDKRQIEIAK